ncbi:MAG: ABC transporter ATP-binding protein [Oscillospiraceae bacterium]|nr:ABC transporter ATP-binding protein [Oscillospiraceae bacterium]
MIELKDLSAGYNGVETVHRVCALFPPGEVTVLIGPNGSGKTTLLRAAAGLIPPMSGAVLLDGRSLGEYSSRQAAQRIAFLPQSRTPPQLSAERLVLHGRFPYLTYPRRYRKEDREIAGEALRQAGAGELAQKPVCSLSGGERQKVYLAMAIAQDTETVLLDEPTTYLDIRCQLEVMELARELSRRGKAVVMVLHDLNLALRCASRLLLLENGSLQAAGPAEELVRSKSLSRVFGVQVRALPDKDSVHYVFSPLP